MAVVYIRTLTIFLVKMLKLCTMLLMISVFEIMFYSVPIQKICSHTNKQLPRNRQINCSSKTHTGWEQMAILTATLTVIVSENQTAHWLSRQISHETEIWMMNTISADCPTTYMSTQ